ncbi:hypothetical protein [Sodalis ligni]|uniref:Ribulose-phosphate 3-epimerase n=1 Tax=Sodalis ligni TaxID=2697027 RepID=A0A4V2Q2N9_9GAMM|nr:hypothetical protein [Sodalis ligni]TCL03548.1 ribulose-phosphate 3-epimerase [Sodalis ligni]
MNISASVYAADQRCIMAQLLPLLPHLESLHFDVMDGLFVPFHGLNQTLFRQLRDSVDLPIDVHLMIRHPQSWALRFAEMGARWIAFHPEACENPLALLRAIRDYKSRAYLALSPHISVSSVRHLLEEADGALILSAPPGGGDFMPEMLAKARALPAGLPVVHDGKMQRHHAGLLRNLPGDLVVMGTALFGTQ